MRDALTKLLYRHYPGLYRQAKLTMSQTSMCRGFSCHDGWFALLDALSETIIAIDPDCEALQVKEKFGTLQFYFSGDHDLLYLTVGAAEFYSSRICERTGAPGDLMSTTSSWPLYATLSVEGIEQLNDAAGTTRVFEPVAEEMRLEPGTLPSVEIPQLPAASARASWSQTEAISLLRKRHEHTLGARSIIDIPKGGFDLADTVMSKIYRRFRCDNSPGGRSIPKILRLIWGDASGLSVKFDEASLPAVARSEIDSMSERRQHTETPVLETETAKLRRSLAGVCLFANNMSKRIDPSTGRTGPVDDDGRLRF